VRAKFAARERSRREFGAVTSDRATRDRRWQRRVHGLPQPRPRQRRPPLLHSRPESARRRDAGRE